MRVEELYEGVDDGMYDDITLEIEDRPGRLMTNLGEPVKYLYRTISSEEYADIKESGMIKAGGFYGRIHAAAIPTGGDGKADRVIKIKYDPSDGWTPKRASTGVYATTWENVSADKIVDTIPLSIVKTNWMLLKTRFSQYMEYQAR